MLFSYNPRTYSLHTTTGPIYYKSSTNDHCTTVSYLNHQNPNIADIRKYSKKIPRIAIIHCHIIEN